VRRVDLVADLVDPAVDLVALADPAVDLVDRVADRVDRAADLVDPADLAVDRWKNETAFSDAVLSSCVSMMFKNTKQIWTRA